MPSPILQLHFQLRADHAATAYKLQFKYEESLDELVVELAQTDRSEANNEAAIVALINAYLLRYYMRGDEKCVLQAEYIQQKFGTQSTRNSTKAILAIANAVVMARAQRWIEMVRLLTPMLVETAAAAEVLVLLSVAYSMLSRADDAIKSAKLAVDMCHTALETEQQPSRAATLLPLTRVLPLSYYCLANELRHLNHMEEVAVSWHERCLSLCRKERLSAAAMAIVEDFNRERDALESPEIGEDTSLSLESDDLLNLLPAGRHAIQPQPPLPSKGRPPSDMQRPPIAPGPHKAATPSVLRSSAAPDSSYEASSSADSSSLQYSTDASNQATSMRPRPLSAAPRLSGDVAEPSASSADPYLSLDAHFAAKRVLKLETIDDVSYITEEEGPSPALRQRPKSAVSKLGGSYVSTSVSSPSHRHRHNSYSSHTLDEEAVEEVLRQGEQTSLATSPEEEEDAKRTERLNSKNALDDRSELQNFNRCKSVNFESLQAIYDELRNEANDLDKRIKDLRKKKLSADVSLSQLTGYLRRAEIRESQRMRRLEKRCEWICDAMVRGFSEECGRLMRSAVGSGPDRLIEGAEVEMRCENENSTARWCRGVILLERCDGTYDVEAAGDGALYVGVSQEALRLVKPPHIPIRVGDFVECSVSFPGSTQRWLPCYVEAILDGSFTVEFLDGSVEQRVSVSRMRALPSPAPGCGNEPVFEIGMPVVMRARLGWRWRCGTIVRKRNNRAYDILLEGCNHTERGVPVYNIRALDDCLPVPRRHHAADFRIIITKTAQLKLQHESGASAKTLAKLRDELREKNNQAALTIQRATRRRLSSQDLPVHDHQSPAHDGTSAEEIRLRFRNDMHRHQRLMCIVSSERFVANRLRQERLRHNCAVTLQRCARRYLAGRLVSARRMQMTMAASFLNTQYTILESEQSLLGKLLDCLRVSTEVEESSASAEKEIKLLPPSSVGSLVDENIVRAEGAPHAVSSAALTTLRQDILAAQEEQWRLYERKIADIIRRNNAVVVPPPPPLSSIDHSGALRSLHTNSQEGLSIVSSVQLPPSVQVPAHPVTQEEAGDNEAESMSCMSQEEYVQCSEASVSSFAIIKRTDSAMNSSDLYEATEVVALAIEAPFEFCVVAATVDDSLCAASADSDESATSHFVVFQKCPEAQGKYSVQISWGGKNYGSGQCTISIDCHIVSTMCVSHDSHDVEFRPSDNADPTFTLHTHASSLRIDRLALSLQGLWELHVGWLAQEALLLAALRSEVLACVRLENGIHADLHKAIDGLRSKRKMYSANRKALEEQLRNLLCHWAFGLTCADDCDFAAVLDSLKTAASSLFAPVDAALRAQRAPNFSGAVESAVEQLKILCENIVVDFYLTNIVPAEKFIPLLGRCRIMSRIACDEVAAFRWEMWAKQSSDISANWSEATISKFLEVCEKCSELDCSENADAILAAFINEQYAAKEKSGVQVEYEESVGIEKELSRFSQSDTASVERDEASSSEVVYDVGACDEAVVIRITCADSFACRDLSLHEECVSIPCSFPFRSKTCVEQWLLFARCSFFDNKYRVDIEACGAQATCLVLSDSEITTHAVSKRPLALTVQSRQYLLQISTLRFSEVEEHLQCLWDAQVAWQVQQVLIDAAAQELLMRGIAHFACYQQSRSEAVSAAFQLLSDTKDLTVSAHSMRLQYSEALALQIKDTSALIDGWLVSSPMPSSVSDAASTFVRSLADEFCNIARRMVSGYASLALATASDIPQQASAVSYPEFVSRQLDFAFGELRNLIYEFIEEVRVGEFIGAVRLVPLLSRCKLIGHAALDHLTAFPWTKWAEGKAEWYDSLAQNSQMLDGLHEKFSALSSSLLTSIADMSTTGTNDECVMSAMSSMQDLAAWIISYEEAN